MKQSIHRESQVMIVQEPTPVICSTAAHCIWRFAGEADGLPSGSVSRAVGDDQPAPRAPSTNIICPQRRRCTTM